MILERTISLWAVIHVIRLYSEGYGDVTAHAQRPGIATLNRVIRLPRSNSNDLKHLKIDQNRDFTNKFRVNMFFMYKNI